MDPTANYRQQIASAQAIERIIDRTDDKDGLSDEDAGLLQDEAAGLAELVLGLNRWIAGGGFLPEQITVSTGTPTPAQGITVARLIREEQAVSAAITRPRKDEDRHHIDIALYQAPGMRGGPPLVVTRDARIARDGSEVPPA